MPKKEDGLTSKVLPPELSTSKGVSPKSTDELVYPNSPIMDIYGDGHAFSIHSNQKLYEIIKLVKDIIDRQFYNQGKKTISFGFNINVLNHFVEFIMTFDNKTENEKSQLITQQGQENYLDFADELANLITMVIQRKYEDTVEIIRNIEQVGMTDEFLQGEGKTEIRIRVIEKIKEEKEEEKK